MFTSLTRSARGGRRRRGFALTETIAALVILAVGIPPMLWAIREAHTMRVNPVLASRARWLAVEKLEDVIADRHSATRGYGYLSSINYPVEPAVTGFTAFSRGVRFLETSSNLAAPSLGGGYMNVTVVVGWTDAGGDAQQLRVSSVLTEYPGS